MTVSRNPRQGSGALSSLFLLVLALVMAYALYQSHTLALGAAYYWFERVGWVMFGLLPLTAYFLYVVGRILITRQAATESVRKDLDIILFAAPLLGMLGTVDGLREALQQFYLIDGVENLMEVLAEFLNGASRMLYTTEWGLIIALPAGLMKKLIFSEKAKEKRSETKVHSEPHHTVATVTTK
ncbi:MAG: MotA/TolQ/ExbB proton channel family protein [Candidatus Thiodiazotropha endolucinida]|nr:MotA/TolQ/ExbB proton channel family protein [Candidatus Thiodiazotropha taylori]MCW4316689.1 MotA/TolQ/ExbB proton channel family protein [Candidatus Thiodiazotropha taylori]